MKKILLLLLVTLSLLKGIAQKHVGIGTTNPLAALHVADSSVLFTGPSQFQINPPPPPLSGAGGRMMWYVSKGAFRAGAVSGNNWDQNNIGYSSFASGYDTKASGDNATAMGLNTTASGQESIASGYFSNALGNLSTALGNQTIASGNSSTAMGSGTTASGSFSTAMGYQTVASGQESIATGYQSIASGIASTAMGNTTTASGISSTAMGVNANTNNHVNSFCIAGAAGNVAAINTTDNQMMMRFDNYTFWVSSANFAYLIPASNGWAYTSDVNKKERFEDLNGETVLKKMSKIPSYSWNFKANDTKQYRHYGIMAQDFYNAFGKDSYGTIGNDTTVSPLDLLGVAYSGIKALEKRSAALATENKQLKAANLALQNEMAEVKAQVVKNVLINQQMKEDNFVFQKAIIEIKKQFEKLNELLAVKQKVDASKIPLANNQ